MPLEGYLLPGEEVVHWSDFHVTLGETRYRVFITNLRLLLYRESGLLFKEEEIISERFNQIQGLQFTQQGAIKKRGVLRFNASGGEFVLEGPVNGMRAIFKALQERAMALGGDPHGPVSS